MEYQSTSENQKKGRKGFTTGTCGAAAALAAAVLLFEGEELNQVSLTTPNGTCLQIAIDRAEAEEGFACCGVVKDAGDDPDVTDGALVLVMISQDPKKGTKGNGKSIRKKILENAKNKYPESMENEHPESMESEHPESMESEHPENVENEHSENVESEKSENPESKTPKNDQTEEDLPADTVDIANIAGDYWYVYRPEEADKSAQATGSFSLFLRGGKGIGVVTRKGLSSPPGMWAINPVPRKMIFQQVAAVCHRCGISGPVYITIFIPDGEALAAKTFNPRLGVEGGLSVLGTSGIVEPMSEKALLETIRLEIRQKKEEGRRALLVVPGNYGEQFVSDYMGMSLSDGIKCSNYIGETIDMAAEAGMEKLLFVGHAGKLIKVAAGIMNTHSAVADGRMECLAAYGAACGAPAEMVCRILDCITVDEALGILEEVGGLRDGAVELAMERIHENLKRRGKGALQIEAVLFTNDRGILGVTSGAIGLIDKMTSNEKR